MCYDMWIIIRNDYNNSYPQTTLFIHKVIQDYSQEVIHISTSYTHIFVDNRFLINNILQNTVTIAAIRVTFRV